MAEIKKRTKCEDDSVSLLADGLALSDVTEWIPTGFPALDSIFGGGWPVGRASEVAGSEGSGKCLANGTLVRMFDGSLMPVEDVAVGAFVMGDDSTPREVLETHSGEAPLYRVRVRGGDYFDCTGNHQLCFRLYVKHKHGGGRFVHHDMPLLVYLQQSKRFRQHAMAYRVLPRKKASSKGQRVNSLHSSMQIEPIGPGAYTGLVVSGNQRFVLGNYLVTHNSALAHMAIKQCQLLGGEPMIIDFEHALDRKKMQQLEIDEDRLIYSDPVDVEEAWDEVWTALDYAEKHPPKAPFLIVWDSVAGTVARSERTEKSHADRHVASRAGSMDKGARKMFRRIAKVRAHMLWINQERVVFGSKSFFQEKTTPGGAQLKYASSLRLTMWRKNIKYKVGDEEEVVGYKSYVRTNKCRLAPPHRKAYFVLDFLHGPSPEMTMFHYLQDAKSIKAGSSGLYTGSWSKKKFRRRDWLKVLEDPKFLTGAIAAYEQAVEAATRFVGSTSS